MPRRRRRARSSSGQGSPPQSGGAKRPAKDRVARAMAGSARRPSQACSAASIATPPRPSIHPIRCSRASECCPSSSTVRFWRTSRHGRTTHAGCRFCQQATVAGGRSPFPAGAPGRAPSAPTATRFGRNSPTRIIVAADTPDKSNRSPTRANRCKSWGYDGFTDPEGLTSVRPPSPASRAAPARPGSSAGRAGPRLTRLAPSVTGAVAEGTVRLTCSPKPEPSVMRVNGPQWVKETLDAFDRQEAAYARADHRQAS